MVRRAFLTLHQWAGLAGALFLIVIAVSGSALVFENEIDRALNPSTSYVAPAGQPLPLEELLARFQAADPREQVGGLRIADTPDQAYELSLRSRQSAMIDRSPAACSAFATGRRASRGGCTCSTRSSPPARSVNRSPAG